MDGGQQTSPVDDMGGQSWQRGLQYGVDHVQCKVAPIIANEPNHLQEEEVKRRKEASRS